MALFRPVPKPCRLVHVLPAFAVAMALTACSPVRLVESIGLLSDIAAPARASDEDEAVTRTTLGYVRQGRSRQADLYVPSGRPEAALVLVPGAARRGWRDPRLIAFAGTLA
ncbi:MAG TPA: hypothetical protein VK943_04110, partial [Arenibaculum sp.]|nr:hypothetical protein [Arenibaculum sp.]